MVSGYFDYNATTPVSKAVEERMAESVGVFSNASSSSSTAGLSKNILNSARESVARLLDCNGSQVAFTSGGSEANNWAIKSTLLNHFASPGHIITTSIEHPSVLDTLNYLSRFFGFEVTLLKPSMSGAISADAVKCAIRPNTQLISVMYANNETGAIQPVFDIAKIANDNNIKFHVDGVQAVGKLAVSMQKLDADFLSFSAHKFYGPKGIGGLYIRDPESVEPLIHGGGQEMGLRAGTENLIAIAGLAQAAEDFLAHGEEWNEHYKECKKYLVDSLMEHEVSFILNGNCSPEQNVPNTANLSITGVRGEALAAFLDRKYGIVVSVGSACSNNKKKKLSHVLLSMGLSEERIQSALRISFGRYTTRRDVERFVESLAAATTKLRGIGQF